MDPPLNGEQGKPSPAPLLSELEIWSDSGKTHCGDLVVGLNRTSVGDGIAIECVNLLILNEPYPLLPLLLFSIASLNAIVART